MHNDVTSRVDEILAEYSGADVDIAQLLCDRHPAERVALTVVDVDGSITDVTFEELTDLSIRAAAVLASQGVGLGDRVATLMGKSVDLVAVILGIWRLGAVYVPLFTAFAGPGVRSRLDGSDARVVVVDADHVHKVPEESNCSVIVANTDADDGLWSRMERVTIEGDISSVSVDGDAPLVHMFTSGTTGAPKGVVHPVRYAAGWHSYLEFGLGVEPNSSFWCAADPGWAYGLYTAIVAPLAAGVRTILLRGGFTAASTWDVISTLRVTDFAAAPTVYRGLRSAETAVPGDLTLRRLSSAGEPLTPEVNEWATVALGLQVHDHYGQTELGMPIGFPHHPALSLPVAPGAMGVALPGWAMTVLHDTEDVPVEPGETGRLAVVLEGSELMTFTGYADSDAAKSRFRSEGSYFLTGDTAAMDDRGVIRFSSRDDDVIIMAGYRIGPFDVESTMLLHPDVIECAVIAAPDSVRGEVVEAFVVLAPGVTDTDEEVLALQQWVKDNYAAHAYPRRIHAVDVLPKTPSGKIQRAELRRRRAGMPAGGRS